MRFGRYFVLLVSLTLATMLHAEKIGLVLSGGGARGIAHVGMIKALEENDIPIDYITGTSMGAIVGGLYAIGISPDEMMDLFRSNEFLNWSTGTITPSDVDYFRQNEITPEIFTTNLSLRDTAGLTFTEARTQLLPTGIVNPIHLNFAFMELFGPYAPVYMRDFDNLFVPYRCMAADVYTRKAIPFRQGRLEDVIRASMSIPVIFNPIVMDSLLLYDGGLYDNYPVDAMRNDFAPDFMIGSIVSAFSTEYPAVDDLYGQLEYLLCSPKQYVVPKEEGLELRFDLTAYSVMDFSKAEEIYQIGYKKTMAMMDSIKASVSSRVDKDSLERKRKAFKALAHPMNFYDIQIYGVNESQESYIRKTIGYKAGETFSIEEFRKAYYSLLSDQRFSQIKPKAVYNEEKNMFRLLLDIKVKNNFVFSIGGNVSSYTSNQLYANIGYQRLDRIAEYYNIDAYIGHHLNTLRYSMRIDVPGDIPGYFTGRFYASSHNFYEREKLFYEENKDLAFLRGDEWATKLRYGFPVMQNKKLEFGYSFGRISDYYMQTDLENYNEDSFDKSYYDLSNISLRLESNTLNHRQYPTSGSSMEWLGQSIFGRESYALPDSVGSYNPLKKNKLTYFQLSAKYTNYHPVGRHFVLGYRIDALYNTKRILNNYTADIIQAPAFAPTPYMQTHFNEGFRANQYVALGLMPIFEINSFMHIRSEFYGFAPIQDTKRGRFQGVIRDYSIWPNIRMAGELSFVVHQSFASMSLFAHYSTYPKNTWAGGLNIGFLLFNKGLIE